MSHDPDTEREGSRPPEATRPERSLSERIGAALRSVVGDAWPERAAAEASGEGSAASLFEEAIHRIGESIEQVRSGKSFLRVIQETGLDRVTAAGHPIDLAVRVEALFRGGIELPGRTVRFAVDGEDVGEARTYAGGLAQLPYHPVRPGIGRVTYTVLSQRGTELRSLGDGEAGLLQVVDGEPVVVVDADVLFAPGPPGEPPSPLPALGALRALGARGWSLVYVDLDDEDRAASVRRVLEAEKLPLGAVLVHPRDDREFHRLNVDFRPVMLEGTVRRLLARGAAAALGVTADARLGAQMEACGLRVADPEQLQAWLDPDGPPDPDGTAALAAIERRATALCEERDAARAEGRERTRHLDLLSASRSVAGNRVHVEFDNRQARRAVFALIEEARESVHVQLYMLKDSRFAEHLVVRLIDRARHGVRVRLVVDSLYSGQELLGSVNPMVRALEGEQGVEVVASDPITFEGGVDAVQLKQRDHRKILVVDGRRAIVSGRNAGDEYYEGFDEVPVTDMTPHDRIPWLDAHIEVEGPLVAEIQRAFARNWTRNTGRELPDGELHPPLGPEGGVTARVVVHDGIADTNGLGAYEAIIQDARRSIYIVNDFPVVSRLARGLLRAVDRGVDVHFLTGCALPRRGDGTFFKGGLHRELFEYMTKHRFEWLIEGGVQVYEYAAPELPNIVASGGRIRPYVHAKVMASDGQVVSVGSANLDATASYWEREANVVVEDPDVASAVEDRIRAMIAGSVRLDLESDYWRREAARRSITDTLWPDMVYS